MTYLYNARCRHHLTVSRGRSLPRWRTGAEVELINDNVHIHPAMVRFTFNTFSDRVILIADSMMARGSA